MSTVFDISFLLSSIECHKERFPCLRLHKGVVALLPAATDIPLGTTIGGKDVKSWMLSRGYSRQRRGVSSGLWEGMENELSFPTENAVAED